jgi:hypothetical protein
MSRIELARGSFADCFRSGRLWLIQFFVNPILLALFAAWLLLPVASSIHLIFNFLLALVLLVAVLTLHAGTLNCLYDRQANNSAPILPAFRRALRNLLPIAICVALFCVLWLLVNKLESYQPNVPSYIRSTLPVFLRRHVSLHALDNLFSAAIFIARWILAPGLVLPFLLQVANSGFRGFGKEGFIAWRKTIFNLIYWLVLLFAALVGVLATERIMALTPDFKTSTFLSEEISLAVRLFVSYFLGLFSWILTCSLLARCAATAGNFEGVTRKSAT